MISFIICLTILIGGYFIYSRYVDKLFGPDDRLTPAIRLHDGIDYVAMPTWKIFLIQFLNIAGLGPIFGAIMGGMYGPVVFYWIALGTIFAGGVHDYFSGMISGRYDGASLVDIVGRFLGKNMKMFLLFFILILMILVGTVFVSGPASILDKIFNGFVSINFWITLIFIYFFISTVFPIDKIIGKIYPIFGLTMLFMAAGILISLIIAVISIIAYLQNPADYPDISIHNFNMHPSKDTLKLFPMVFVSVACGAISGFHATQSPLMARCIKSERNGRIAFYGAMTAEGCVALVWAAAGMIFFKGIENFQEFMIANGNNAAVAVNTISRGWMGTFGGILVMLGVVAAPITSADTAFRTCRLIAADFLKFDQKKFWNRVLISIPFFIISIILLQINFDVIWRYFAWSNQTLAAITLWTISVYLKREGKNFYVSMLPAMFMTAVCTTYIIYAPEGLGGLLFSGLDDEMLYVSSIIAGCCVAVFFAMFFMKKENCFVKIKK